jgi:hypothetical protein
MQRRATSGTKRHSSYAVMYAERRRKTAIAMFAEPEGTDDSAMTDDVAAQALATLAEGGQRPPHAMKGLRNNDGVECWGISLSQLLSSSPNVRRLVLHLDPLDRRPRPADAMVELVQRACRGRGIDSHARTSKRHQTVLIDTILRSHPSTRKQEDLGEAMRVVTSERHVSALQQAFEYNFSLVTYFTAPHLASCTEYRPVGEGFIHGLQRSSCPFVVSRGILTGADACTSHEVQRASGYSYFSHSVVSSESSDFTLIKYLNYYLRLSSRANDLCSRCGAALAVECRQRLVAPPSTLMVCIQKRHDTVVATPVDIYLHAWGHSASGAAPAPRKYSLTGVAHYHPAAGVAFGSAGHYTSRILHEGYWLECSDSKVTISDGCGKPDTAVAFFFFF